MNKQESQNQVSIIINGVRYDSIKEKEIRSCQGCELLKKSRICLLTKLCGLNGTIFKKSDKKYEP